MHCEGCPLFEKIGKEKVPVLGPYRRKVGEGLFTNLKGFGNTDHPEIVVVTDGPSAEDLAKSLIMTGDQRTVLANELAANGFDGNKAYYMPAHRCHLTIEEKQNKKLVKSVLEHCKPYVNDVLKHLQPKMILTLGDTAFKQVLNQTGISKRRGMLQYSEDFQCWVMPTYATGFCLRDQKQFAKWRPDISQMFQFMKNGYQLMETGELDYRDVESIKSLIASNPEAVAVDTETQGKDFANPNSIVISYSVSTSPTNGYNIWLATEVVEGEHELVIKWPRKVGRKEELVDVFVKKAAHYDEKVEELRTILSDPTIKKYMMNGNYDLHRFRQLGIEREEVKAYTLDVQSVMHTLDPDMYKRASLQDIQSAVAPYRVDHKAKFAQEVDKSDMLAAAKENPERHSQYACGDTASTFDCATILKDRLCTDMRLAEYYIKLVHPVTTEVLYEIEKNGVLFDQERLPAAKEKVADFLNQQTNKFISLMPRKVLERQREKGLKLSRTDLLRDVLFSKEGFNLNPLEKTPAGGDGVGRKLLVRMRDELDDDHPAKELISTYIEWGPYQKLYSTYLNGFPKCVFPDGRFHPNISKCATATGRTAVSNPNLQQIPKRNKDIANVIRSLIIADPGYSFVTADASQAELRWAAVRAFDEILRGLYVQGKDVHTHTAEMLIAMDGRNPQDMSASEMKSYRTKAKAVNFGLLFGMQAKKLQAYARDEYGVKITLAEAEAFRKGFFTAYPALEGWHRDEIAKAKEQGFVRTDYGFIRRLANINSKDFSKRSEDERAAINTPIQSASNDTVLFSALTAHRQNICEDKAKLVCFIHDELIYMVRDDFIPTFAPRLYECMVNPPIKKEFGIEFPIPFGSDIQTGKTLATLEDYQL